MSMLCSQLVYKPRTHVTKYSVFVLFLQHHYQCCSRTVNATEESHFCNVIALQLRKKAKCRGQVILSNTLLIL